MEARPAGMYNMNARSGASGAQRSGFIFPPESLSLSRVRPANLALVLPSASADGQLPGTLRFTWCDLDLYLGASAAHDIGVAGPESGPVHV